MQCISNKYYAITAGSKCGPEHFHHYTIVILNDSKSLTELWFLAYNQRRPNLDFKKYFNDLEIHKLPRNITIEWQSEGESFNFIE